MCDDNMHPQRLTRTFTSTSHEHSGMDDTACKVLGTTSMPHNKAKCMRAILAANVSEPPTNVGKLPRSLEIGGSRGGPPALHRTRAKELAHRDVEEVEPARRGRSSTPGMVHRPCLKTRGGRPPGRPGPRTLAHSIKSRKCQVNARKHVENT